MKKYFGVAVMMFIMAATALPVFAQGLTPSPSYGLPDLSGSRGIPGLVSTIINIILGLTGLVSVLFIVVGGFQYILSGANEALAKRGKTTITNAIIGLIIVILSYTVITVVTRTFLKSSI
jgi:hypothetical protein